MTPADERLHFLAEVAIRYFEDKLTQQEIAEQLGISRSSISRLLTEAEEAGIVEIRVNYPWRTVPSLEEQIAARFGLHKAVVLASNAMSYQRVLQGLGYLGARYLHSVLPKNGTLAIGWGTSIYQVVRSFPPDTDRHVSVVQMLGSLGSINPVIDGPDIARRMADLLGGRYYYLHAPLIVHDGTLAAALLEEKAIREVLAMARRADVALVGIGTAARGYAGVVRGGYMSDDELAQVVADGAVGDICGYYFDHSGRLLDTPLNHRVIALSLDDLRRIPRVIGVAGGAVKARAILGALRGRLIKVLITDERAAQDILREEETADQKPGERKDTP